ncbi:MAG: SMP-30/gluconolactonase/LRE family protein [Limisphaerales bacterium]
MIKFLRMWLLLPVIAMPSMFFIGCQTYDEDEVLIWEDAATPKEVLKQGAGEGPAWHPTQGLFFSGEGHIQQWHASHGVRPFEEGAGSNGLMFDSQGRLIACEPLHRRVRRLEKNGQWATLTDDYDGYRYNTPNDVTIDQAGRIYFSDPRYGDRSGMEMKDDQGRLVEGVYCIHTGGEVQRVITHEVDRPNGVLVSADDRFLYVADNNNRSQGARKLWRFDKLSDGTLKLSSKTLIFDWKTSRGPDGMAQDALGRLYVAAGINHNKPPHETRLPYPAGIFVFSREGRWMGHLPIPNDEVTNCAFGGEDHRTLFITAGGHLWTMKTAYPGDLTWPPIRP